jgi:hypothetical protein
MKFRAVCAEDVVPVPAQVGLGELDSLLLVRLSEPLWWDSSPTYQRVTLCPCEALHGPRRRGGVKTGID